MMKRSIAALGLGLAIVGGCGQPAPTRSPEPIATAIPAPATAAALQVRGPVEWCGSFGGCAYFAELLGPDQSWQSELEIVRDDDRFAISGHKDLPETLAEGPYAIRLWLQPVSDEVSNGLRSMGPISGSCATAFRVSPGQTEIAVDVSFGFDSCEATAD